MRTAYYMKFIDGHYGSENRIGGQPSYSPDVIPWPPDDDEYFAFVGEFNVDGEAIAVPTVQKIQPYQPIDEGDDPTPAVATVKQILANERRLLDVPQHPLAQPKDIQLMQEIDPDVMPDLRIDFEVGRLFRSKLSGVDPWQESAPQKRFLGQLREFESGLNFGGRTCCLYYLEGEDRVIAELK